MYEFDHLVIAAQELEAGVAWAQERLGVALQAGGQHARYGTHNALLGLAEGLYLEVIAIDPEAAPPAGARWFGLDAFSGAPRLVTWVCRVKGLAARRLPQGFGGVVGLTRGALSWDMAEAGGGR
nr:VOC family protein [Roseobacter sp.]